MAPILYHVEPSPPARAVRMIASALGVELNLKDVDFMGQEHLKPEFLKLNPTHTIPVLDDNGFIVWDSAAIAIYLVEKYGKDDSLYPNDVQKRALIHQYLHFNNPAFQRIRNSSRPLLTDNIRWIPQEASNTITEVYDFLEKFLEGKKWLVGDSLSIADICLLATVTTTNVIVPVEHKWPQLEQWHKNGIAQPFHSVNVKGVELTDQIIRSKLK